MGGRKRERSIERGTVHKPSGKRVPVWENLCECVYAERECIKLTCVNHMPSPLSPSCHQKKQLLFYHQPLNKKIREHVFVCQNKCAKVAPKKDLILTGTRSGECEHCAETASTPLLFLSISIIFFLFSFRVLIEVKACIYM